MVNKYLEKNGHPNNIKDLDKHKFITYGRGAPSPVFNPDWALKLGSKDNKKRKPVMKVNSVYGLLLAFGMLFPNSIIYLYMAIPLKTKYFVAGIGILSIISGISNNPGDNVAHFAHLGGMIFGILLLKYWKKKGEIWF